MNLLYCVLKFELKFFATNIQHSNKMVLTHFVNIKAFFVSFTSCRFLELASLLIVIVLHVEINLTDIYITDKSDRGTQ